MGRRIVRTRILSVCSVAVLLLASCGDDSDDGSAETEADGEIPSSPGFDPDTNTIRLGVLSVLSGPIAVVLEDFLAGSQVYVDRINAAGGIAGEYQVELVMGDSEDNPQRAVEVYNGMKDDVVAFTHTLGTPIVGTLLPLFEEDNIVSIASTYAEQWVNEPHLLPYSTTYNQNGYNSLYYAYEELGLEGATFCTSSEDEATNEAHQEGISRGAEELDIEFGARVLYPSDADDLTPQVQELRSAGCEVILHTGAVPHTTPLVTAATELDFQAMWIDVFAAFNEAFLDSPISEYLQENWIAQRYGTSWNDPSVPGQAQMLDDIEEFNPDVNPAYIVAAGYCELLLMEQVLTQAVENGDLSREGILEASHQIETVDFLGLMGEFVYGEPEDRQAPTVSGFFEIDPNEPTGLAVVEHNYSVE